MHAIRNLKHSFWAFITRRMHLNWKLKSGIDVIVRNYADWCTYNDLFVNDEYTRAIEDAVGEWQTTAREEPLCVLDLGANMGYFTLQLADVFLQRSAAGTLEVCLVEASAEVAAELKRRIAIQSPRVIAKVINGLVGKREGSAQLNFGREDTINFVGDGTDRGLWKRAKGAQTVPYVDLMSAAADMPILHLIKCDIEGSEFSFIENYPELLRKTKRIVVEFHAPFGDIPRAIEALKTLGFTKESVLRESPMNPTVYFSRM